MRLAGLLLMPVVSILAGVGVLFLALAAPFLGVALGLVLVALTVLGSAYVLIVGIAKNSAARPSGDGKPSETVTLSASQWALIKSTFPDWFAPAASGVPAVPQEPAP
jgi:hypothetical protein